MALDVAKNASSCVVWICLRHTCVMITDVVEWKASRGGTQWDRRHGICQSMNKTKISMDLTIFSTNAFEKAQNDAKVIAVNEEK